MASSHKRCTMCRENKLRTQFLGVRRGSVCAACIKRIREYRKLNTSRFCRNCGELKTIDKFPMIGNLFGTRCISCQAQHDRQVTKQHKQAEAKIKEDMREIRESLTVTKTVKRKKYGTMDTVFVPRVHRMRRAAFGTGIRGPTSRGGGDPS